LRALLARRLVGFLALLFFRILCEITLADALTVALPEYNDTLSPSYALRDPTGTGEWLALVQIVAPWTEFDRATDDHGGWHAAPHGRAVTVGLPDSSQIEGGEKTS